MRLNPATCTRILAPEVTCDIDPTGSTVEIKVDGQWYPAEWTAVAVAAGTKWKRPARTTGYFAGPDAVDTASAVVLTIGRHATKVRVTKGTDVLVADTGVLEVK